jgi:hypothetical protein
MEPLYRPTELDQETASFIAAGLRELARADGTHPSELALIEAFEQEVGAAPATFDLTGDHPLRTPEMREMFLRTCILLTLADGRISEVEGELLGRWAGMLGIDVASLAELYRQVKKTMLGHFQGAALFRDQAMEIGSELGLEEKDILTSLD